jgi:diguanylate cyclase (GGDEF)-like protein
VIVAVSVVTVLWDVTGRRALLTWLVVLVVLAAIRLTLIAAYRVLPEVTAPTWEGWFIGTTLAVGAVWGVGGWVLMPTASLAHQAMLYFFLMGIAGGAVATYGAEARLASYTVSLLILPATIKMVALGSTPLYLMALSGVLYTVAAFRATHLLSLSLRRSLQLTHELAIAHARAQELARTDVLTGLNNRRAFLELAGHTLQQASRYGRPASMILLDVDRFKSINDESGHAAGDEVLRAVADVVQTTVRLSDVPGRLGGEEFAILLPETRTGDAVLMAERLRTAFSTTPVRTGETTVRFTASFGVAERSDNEASVEELMARADAALYQAKRGGRDQVQLSAQHPGAPRTSS